MPDLHEDKGPLKSKKFIAFLTSDLTLKALAVLTIAWAWNLDEISNRVFFLLLAIVIISGFISVGFILGQAGLDRYVRLAQIAANGAANGRTNGSLNRVLNKGTKGMIKVTDEAEAVPDEEPDGEEPEPTDPEDEGEPEA
jgi:hypothetical protein